MAENHTSQHSFARIVAFGVLGLMLALGAIVSALIIANAAHDFKLAGQTINVMGYAEKILQSDRVAWRALITTRQLDRLAVYNRLDEDTKKLLAFLQKNGVEEGAVNVSAPLVMVNYKYDERGNNTQEISNYSGSKTFDISSSNVELLTKLSKEYGDLVHQGVELDSQPPQYFYSKLSELKTSMIAEAAKNAKERAEQFAQGSGSKVGAMRSARQGVFQVTAPNSTEVSDYGVSDTSSIEKNIKAVVAIEYSIIN